jgi:ubiquinone/menaquinone biosynthesis C-methylase UbiE
LPFASDSIRLIVASMSLQDIDDLDRAIQEASRVLEPGGQFCIAAVHPFVSAQDDDTVHTDRFSVSRPYLQPRRYEDHVERDGLSMTFTSMHRPLSAYTEALTGNGLAITAVREYGDRAVPWLLALRAEKRTRPASSGAGAGG